MTTLRWLHLTDLHIDKADDARRQLAGELFREDLSRLTRAHGPWDVVVFTGDLAFSGQPAQYAILEGELDRLWELFKSAHPSAPPPILLAVPGNHDLARPGKGSAVARGLLRDASAREALWSGDLENLEPVRRWFAAYDAWWKACRYRPNAGITDGLLPGDFAYVFEKEGASFGFVGMNSAFLDLGDEVHEGDLWTDVRQIQPACGGDLFTWLKRCNLAFLLTHHPPVWLNVQSLTPENPASLTEDYFAAHLCGHLHEAAFEEHKSGGGAARRLWQTASLFGIEWLPDGRTDRKYGYTAGEIKLTPEGARFQVWPRLAARLQDKKTYRLTADFTFQLEDDLAHTAEDLLPARHLARVTPLPLLITPTAGAMMALATWSEGVKQSPLWLPHTRKDPVRTAALQRLAAKVAEAAFTIWQHAEAVLPGNPWRDERYPIRVLERLAAFVPAENAGPEETLILLLAPFVREAVLAAGAVWMATVKPLDLGSTAATTEPRLTLENVHRSREDLLRHAARITGEARDALGFWMMEHALQRSAHLWQRKPPIDPLKDFLRALDRAQREESGAAASLDRELLFRLARAVGQSPDVLEAEGGLGREDARRLSTGDEIRVASLAYLLGVAGAAALDLRAADEVAVDHVGREAGVEPAAIREAIRAATWSERQDRFVLAHVCAHPVIDYVLRDLVERADAVLERTRLARERSARPCPLLARLPTRVASDDVHPAEGTDGRPLYELPHLRFRLDHQRIREMLMGEQLYEDPALAIRELYQNALDACRYRRARNEYLERTGNPTHQPYQGCIAFYQSVDERGRAYIECKDNGVGMTREILACVFAVAGKRFHDMADFLEERAAWRRCAPSIEIYPNSQFGVGVLSYFMLADEVTVWTRRFEASGSLGEPLVLRIASASGLFRLETAREEDMPEAGTRVRLYLAKAEYKRPHDSQPQPIACASLLGELLWVAEFPTTAEDGEDRLQWEPGQLKIHSLPYVESISFLPTTDPDVWWCTAGRLLCDGIRTKMETDCVVVNLQGIRSPVMSTDRTKVLQWKSGWLSHVVNENWPTLVAWDALSFEFFWRLARSYPRAARHLYETMHRQDASIRLASKKTQIPIKDVAIFFPDEIFMLRYEFLREDEPVDIPLVQAWRMATWAKTRGLELPATWPSVSLLSEVSKLVSLPLPGDADMLMNNPTTDYRSFGRANFEDWLQGEMSPVRVIHAAERVGLSRSAMMARVAELSPLGIRAPAVRADAVEQLALASEDWILLSYNLDGLPPWCEGEVSWNHLLRVSQKVRVLPSKIVMRLRYISALGLGAPTVDLDRLDELACSEDDLRLLSYNFTGRWPWLVGKVKIRRILRSARVLRLALSRVFERLAHFAPLSVRLPSVDVGMLAEAAPTEADIELLSRYEAITASWREGQIPPKLVMLMLEPLGLQPAQAIDRLGRLGLLEIRMTVSATDGLDASALSADERRLITWELEGNESYVTIPAPLRHLIDAVWKLKQSFAHIVALAIGLGITSEALRAPVAALGEGYQPDKVDLRLAEVFDSIKAPDAVTAFERGREHARYRLWSLTDEAYTDRLERLRPLLEAYLRDRFSSPSPP